KPEAGDYFVEDQNGAVGVTKSADASQVSRPGGNRAGVEHHRLHQYSGDLIASALECLLDAREVVPRQHNRGCERIGWLTVACRGGICAWPGGDEDVVEPAVVMAFEAYESFARG